MASGTVCPYTKQPCKTAEEAEEMSKDLILSYQASVKELNDKKAELVQKRDSLKDEIQIRSKKVFDYQRWHEFADAYQKAIDTSEELAKDASEIMTAILRLESAISDLDNQIVQVRANQKYEELNSKLSNDKLKADEHLELLKRWEKATGVSGYQTKLANEPLKRLETSISKYLQILFNGNEEVGPFANFVLEDKSNTFEFGMMENNIRRSFKMLSSGEKCMYTLALLMALAFENNTELPVLIIDDMLDHLDSAKITTFFSELEKISDTDKQFIIAGVQKCDEPRCTVRII